MSGAVLHSADVIATSPANVFKKKKKNPYIRLRTFPEWMLVYTGCSELSCPFGTIAQHEMKGSQCGVDSRRSVYTRTCN